jgi:hypothetical protein
VGGVGVLKRRGKPEVVVVSGARASRHDDIDVRQRKYLLTMAVRTVAFVASVVLFVLGLQWIAAAVLALSLIAPIAGVIIANNHVRSPQGRPELFDHDLNDNTPAIGRGPTIDA